jgi:hypothetical protein
VKNSYPKDWFGNAHYRTELLHECRKSPKSFGYESSYLGWAVYIAGMCNFTLRQAQGAAPSTKSPLGEAVPEFIEGRGTKSTGHVAECPYAYPDWVIQGRVCFQPFAPTKWYKIIIIHN